MIARRLAPALLALFALAACGEGGGVMDLAKGAAKAAAEVVDTQTACTLAGQNEAFCGCLQTELGPKIDPAHIDAVGQVIKESLAGAPMDKAAEAATSIDPATRQALITCAARGAIGEAQEGGG